MACKPDAAAHAPEPAEQGFITIVSGLPRSGTSMMMAMLQAGGMPLLIDGARPPDTDNPRGYFEYAPVMRLRTDHAWAGEARSKAVKVISWLLEDLPPIHAYRVVFMRRELAEVIASQRAMLMRRGKPADGDPHMAALFEKHLRHVEEWLTAQRHMRVLMVDHRHALEHPHDTAMTVNAFLGGGLDDDAMASIIDRALHRQRSHEGGAPSP